MDKDDKKLQRRAFAFAAARRIHAQLAREEQLLWNREGQAAKDAGLYAPSTYSGDAASGLRSQASGGRYYSMLNRIEDYLP